MVRPNDTRGIALGLTGSSYNDGLFSIYTNPAGLSFINNYNLGYSHIPSTQMGSKGIFKQDVFGFGIKVVEDICLGFNYLNINYGEMSYYDDHGNLQEGKSGLEIFYFSASKLITLGKNYLSIGGNVKYYNDRISYFKANVIWFDIGVQYRKELKSNNFFTLGISVTNIGNDLKDDNDFTVVRPIKLLRLGMSYNTPQLKSSNLNLLGTIEYQKSLREDEYNYNRWNHVGSGIEIKFKNNIFGRIGYNYDLENVEHKTRGLTYGFGFVTPIEIFTRLPFYLSLSYGRSIKNFHRLDQNVISVEVNFK